MARSSMVGGYALDLVHARIAPRLLEELPEREPKGERGRHRHYLHRWFTEDIGHLEPAKHIFAVNTLMRANTSWDRFNRSMQRAMPKQTANLELNLTDNEGESLRNTMERTSSFAAGISMARLTDNLSLEGRVS